MTILGIPLSHEGRIAGAVNNVRHANIAIAIEDAGVRQLASHSAVPRHADVIAEPLKIAEEPALRTAARKRTIGINTAAARKPGVAGANEDLERCCNQI